MTECRGCGRHINIDCPYCPHCGKPCGMRTYVAPPKKHNMDKPAIKVALLASVGLFTIILWQLFSKVNDASQNPAEPQTSQSASSAQ